MKRFPPGNDGYEDPDGTDTLPVPQLDLSDTGTLDLPAIAAIPVGVPDLAESLRESERQLALAARRLAELEPQLDELNRRCALLQGECNALREAAAQPPAPPAVMAPPPEPSPPPAPLPPPASAAAPGVSAGQERAERDLAALRRQNERLQEALGSVQGLIAVREGLLAEAEDALRRERSRTAAARPEVPQEAPPAAAPAAESPAPELLALQARCAELEAALATERARPVQQEPAPQAASVAAAAPALLLGTVLRVLVRVEGDTEVVYPVGRHTTIGRTPDNDIQVNTTFVSRHHAVLLAGTDHCIVEDLNSTNGVLVNGQRTGRQVLHDGDTVTIGKTHFRYQQRS